MIKKVIFFLFPQAKVLEYGFLGLMLLIDSVVYRIISMLYSLFIALSKVEILDNANYTSIANRLYLFVGVIALFTMTFSLLKALVDPDKLSEKIVVSFKTLVTSIALLILMPTIFKYAFSFQNAIIQDGVIHNLFDIKITNKAKSSNDSMAEMCSYKDKQLTVDDIKVTASADIKTDDINENMIVTETECRGNYIAMTLFESFFYPKTDDIKNNGKFFGGTTWKQAKKHMIYTGNFGYLATFISNIDDNEVVYLFIISTIAGAYMAYVILSFCIDLGVRCFKLAFYQLIAPIPILFRLIPNQEKHFSNWMSKTIKAFLEIFMRVLLIEFIVFIAGNFLDVISQVFENMDAPEIGLFAKGILIIGLLTFAKQAPKLFQDAIGLDGTGINLKIKDKLTSVPIVGGAFAAGYGLANKAQGAATGALGAGWTSAMNGGGFKAGAKYGAVKGFRKGGHQFNSQRQGMYEEFGFSGKSGWLGGQSYIEKKGNDIVKASSKAAQTNLKEWIKNKENTTPAFQNFLSKHMTDMKNEHQLKYNQLEAQYANESRIYAEEENRIRNAMKIAQEDYQKSQAEIQTLQAQYDSEKAQFDANRDNRINALRQKHASNPLNFTENDRRELENLQNQTYSNSAITDKINELSKVKFDKSKFEDMIARNNREFETDMQLDGLREAMKNEQNYINDVDGILSNAAHEAARADYSEIDTDYGRRVSAMKKIDSKAEVKKYLDSVEGQQAIAVRAAAEKRLADEAKGKGGSSNGPAAATANKGKPDNKS